MKHRYQIVGILSLLSLAVVAGFLFSGSGSAAAGEEMVEQTLWGPYWTVEPGFTSTLEMKNNRAEETLTVNVSLYFANGEEYYLDPMQLGPRQTTVINLNQVYESLPASIRARASKEGTLEVEHNGANFQALMGSVSVTNPEQGIAWIFRLYSSAPDLPIVPVRGLFWFPDQSTAGFVAVQNASEEHIDVNPLFRIGEESHSVPPVRLAPGQGFKLELRKELRRLGLGEVTAGGIEFTYDGPSDALKAHGVLFNNQGFSTEIDFHLQDGREEERALTLRTPRFAIGLADPALGLPTTTTFEPTLALHNFAESELLITLAVGYRTEEGAQELQIPLVLSAGDTQVLSLHLYLEGVVPEEAHWASLEVSYSSRENQLAAELVSVSADGEHSIRSVMNWVQGSASEGWLWRADADHNTYITMFNADTEEATVNVSLDYYDQGQRQSYELPELTIPARASELVNVGALIAAGVPDADGDVIPSEVGWGGYRVRKIGRRIHTPLITETLVFNRRTHNYLTFYNSCCWIFGVNFTPSLLGGFPGAGGQVNIFGINSCSGNQVNLTTSGDFFSLNPPIATVGINTGWASFVAPGGTDIDGSLEYWGRPRFILDACVIAFGAALVAILVDDPPPTVSLSCPSSVTRGGSAQCTATVTGGATISAWRFTSGSTTVNRTSGTGNSTWSGTMVTSGTVRVEAGPTLSAEKSITVNPRNWHTNPASPTQVPNGTFITLPVPPQPSPPDSGLGISEEQTGNAGFSHSLISDSGPNHGYAYYASPPTLSPFLFRYTINPDLENSGSVFSQHQCGSGGFISWSNLITQTRRHEFNSAIQSHHAFYSNAVNSGSNNPGTYVESRIAIPGTNLTMFNGDTQAGLNTRYGQIFSASILEPFPVNFSEGGISLGGVNYAPYVPCN
jgi:hypothetical protein